MENIILVVHLLLALALIISVLLQRSEGGGLGIGGGGGVMSGRPAPSPMAKFTWILALAFIGTSLTLTYFATQNSAGNSVIDRVGTELPAGSEADGLVPPSLGDGLELPPSSGDGPLVPPSD